SCAAAVVRGSATSARTETIVAVFIAFSSLVGLADRPEPGCRYSPAVFVDGPARTSIGSRPMRPALAALALFATLSSSAPRALAQSEEEQIVTSEEPDATRLDVERLPPEAIQITRELYAHGFFLE